MPDDFPVDITQAQRRLKKRLGKRRSDRLGARRKRPPTKPRGAPPRRHTAKAWADDEKAQWFNALCVHIQDGGSVAAFCRKYPHGPQKDLWYQWLQDDPIIAEKYIRAREISADTLADDCISIADEVRDAGHMDSARVNAARLRVDARKWVASKLKPKVYADRIETVQSGALTVKHEITDDERVKALALILGRQVIQSAPSLIEAQRRLSGPVIDHDTQSSTDQAPSTTGKEPKD
jgi:hypothetical protein